ncbi:hypothetical protein HYALB_00008496 [Hymenoscyphus albidus]|uniref:Uncharacterized protein n=1 Tax=Hymenoscyphus albidus TaxID=595503 RepID=A0A9N9Q9C5_9HELO|nr:hypothetical protein HYALB_00008496 [Hymenoscyphus albidus]
MAILFSRNAFAGFSIHENKEMIKLLVPAADWSELSNATRAGRLWYFLSFYSLNEPETLSFIHNKYEVSFPELSSAEILVGLNYVDDTRIKLHLLQFILFGRNIDSVLCRNEVETKYYGSFNLLRLFAIALRNSFSKYTIRGVDTEEALPILQQLIRGGSNLHTTIARWERCLDCGACHSASTTSFGGMFTGWNKRVKTSRIKNLVRYWLRALQDSGVDLHEYGRRKKEISNGGSSLNVHWHAHQGKRYRLMSFTFGPAPEDWELFYTEDNISTEVLEFWDMVDHPERALSGAWVEDLFEPNSETTCADIWDNFIWP